MTALGSDLRKWFGHDPEKWPEFRERYLEELTSGDASEDLEALKKLLEQHDRITLVFAAKDTEHNNAVALRDYILNDQLPPLLYLQLLLCKSRYLLQHQEEKHCL